MFKGKFKSYLNRFDWFDFFDRYFSLIICAVGFLFMNYIFLS